MSFGQALVLFPLAQALHVFEEWPGLPRWARRFASSKYSDREYIITHVLAILFAIGSVLLVRTFPNRWMVFGFFAFAFGPGHACTSSLTERVGVPFELRGEPSESAIEGVVKRRSTLVERASEVRSAT